MVEALGHILGAAAGRQVHGNIALADAVEFCADVCKRGKRTVELLLMLKAAFGERAIGAGSFANYRADIGLMRSALHRGGHLRKLGAYLAYLRRGKAKL